MKILQVCPQYFPATGGLAEYARNVSERLAKRHEVAVFTTDTSGLPKEEEVNGVLVKRFRSFSPNNSYHISLSMLKELRGSQFDIVHGIGYHALPLFFSRYASRNKFVVTSSYVRRGRTPFRDILIRLYKPFGKKIFQEANRVIAVSNYEKDLLMEDFQIDCGKITLIPCGVNLKEFQGLKKKGKEYKTILCVAALKEYKGIQYIIQALPLLEESTRLEIVGKETPYKKNLIKLAARLGVAHRIDFYQGLHKSEMPNRYANANLFILLSRHEAFGIAVAEALASKTPCIVANTSALQEWIDNKNCFGVDYPISSDALASLITEVMGMKVREVSVWDWDEVTKQTETVYMT